MRKFLSLALLALVTVAIAYFAFERRGGGVSSNSTLYVRWQVPMPEVDTVSFVPFQGSRQTLADAVGTLRRAAADPRIATVVITPVADGAMWGQLQELREAVEAVKKAGKPVVAYLESGGPAEYYIASAADRIVLMPAGTLQLTGLATYELFFRGTLDKVGVRADLLHIGDYKTYANTFTERGMTPAHREMNQSLNKDNYDELVRAVASGRKMADADVRRALDAGPYLADEALAAGLVDAVAYEDQIDDDAPVKGTRRITSASYGPGGGGGFGSPRIALLYAVGEINSGQNAFGPTGDMTIGSDTFANWIRTVRADTGIKAVVVRVDSPGGSAVATEVIWRELMLTREVKPVVVSMGNVAASGGYYMALPAHAIVAQPGTLTGSIGVVTGKFVVSGALDKLGVGTGVVTNGANAQMNSPFRPYTDDERAKVEQQMQATYDLFVSRVAAARGSTPDRIDGIAQGRVWTGRQARELGLVDALGGLDDAIALAKARARIDAGASVRLDTYPARLGLFEILSNSLGGVRVELPQPYAVANDAMSRLTKYRPGEALLLMPNLYN
jgi:protease-4